MYYSIPSLNWGLLTRGCSVRKGFSSIGRVDMKVRHVLYVSYAVPHSRVRPLLPDTVPLSTIEETSAFVSVVVLQSEDVRLARLPLFRFNYGQINVRTYVTDPRTGNQAVYFLKSGVTSASISALTRLLGLSWEKVDLNISAERDDSSLYTRYSVSGRWHGDVHVLAEETGIHPTEVAPFHDLESAVDYLVRPMIGLYGSKGSTRRFEISHSSLEPRAMRLLEFRLPLLDAMGLVREEEVLEPHSVLLVPESPFRIFLPPTRLAA